MPLSASSLPSFKSLGIVRMRIPTTTKRKKSKFEAGKTSSVPAKKDFNLSFRGEGVEGDNEPAILNRH